MSVHRFGYFIIPAPIEITDSHFHTNDISGNLKTFQDLLHARFDEASYFLVLLFCRWSAKGLLLLRSELEHQNICDHLLPRLDFHHFLHVAD
jgi:hypothetical protein